jgi:hypothetical protein
MGDTIGTCNLWAKIGRIENQGVCLYPAVPSRSTSASFPKVEQVFQLSWTEFAYFQGNWLSGSLR